MPLRANVPPPDFLTKLEFIPTATCKSPNKISTILTNVQRRNVQTQSPAEVKHLTVFQMAAQGELLLLHNELANRPHCIDARDEQGFPLLLWACANGQKGAVELLAYHGADLSITGDNGESGLLLASCRGHFDVVQYLLKAGCPVDESDELMNTSLMFAVSRNHATVVSLLLDWGADVGAVNGDGLSAFDFAVKFKSQASQRVLEKHICSLLQQQQQQTPSG